MNAQTADKLHMPQRRQFLVLIPFALFYSVAAMLGELEKAADMSILQNLVRWLLWFGGSYALLLLLCTVLSGRKVAEVRSRQGRWYVYVLFTVGCLVCYLPYFLMYYPGWLNNDAVWQIEQALGWVPGSNHHPYFHTLILKVFFMIGYRLSGTCMGGAAFYTFCQILVMAMVFGFFLYQLYKRGTKSYWLALAFLFYAVLPINGLLTICMGKDEFFVASLLLFAWMTVNYDLGEKVGTVESLHVDDGSHQRNDSGKHGVLQWCCYLLVGLAVCLLRSNGIFIFVGTAVVLLIDRMRKGNGRFPVRTFLCVVAVLIGYLICHGPVLKALHVEQPDTIEGLTMPTQHLLCAYLKGGELTEEEIEMINQVAPVDEVGDYYNPWLFDIVKDYIRREGDQQVIADNRWEYFKLWLRAGLRNPLQYLVAEVRQTAGYWAYSVKDYEYVYGEYYMTDNPFDITTQRKFFSYDAELAMHNFLMGFQDLYNRVWSLGLNTWLMVFCLAYMAFDRRNALMFVPFIVLLVTLLLATPVYNEFRYAYGLFAAFPLLFSYSFGARNSGIKNEKTDNDMLGNDEDETYEKKV